jgi:branched-chain amino acid transport system substrate-binding protein
MKRIFISLVLIFCLISPVISPANAKNEVGISKTEILLGATNRQNTAITSYPQDFFTGAQAYFDYLNSKGGIQGRKIRLILRDDKGLPQYAVNEASNLLSQDKVFALFNSASFTTGHLAMASYLQLNDRNIPNLAVTETFSQFSDPSKYKTTFQAAPNSKQEFAVLLHFLEKSLSTTSFNASLPADDTKTDFGAIHQDSTKKLGTVPSSFPNSIGCPGIPYSQNNAGVLSLWTTHCGVPLSPLVTSDAHPLLIRGKSISSSLGAFQVASTLSKNLYANFYMPLHTDLQDPYIEFFTKVFKEFVPNLDFSLEIRIDSPKTSSNYVSQQMYEGANSAYVLSQALAALGPQPTRAGLIAYLRGNSKSLSSATFHPVDYSLGSNIGNTIQYIAKYDGSKWVKVSDYYLINPSGTSIQVVSPQRKPILPDGLPVTKRAEQSVNSITCVKGKLSKKVTATNPKCPAGYKKK